MPFSFIFKTQTFLGISTECSGIIYRILTYNLKVLSEHIIQLLSGNKRGKLENLKVLTFNGPCIDIFAFIVNILLRIY